MARIDRYIAGAVGRALLAVTIGLLGLLLVLDWLARLDDADSALAALFAALGLLPRRLVELAPFAALLGSVFGFGALSSRSELTALRASGVGPAQLLRGAILPLLGLILLAVFASEWLLPRLAAAPAGDSATSTTPRYRWQWQGESLVVTRRQAGRWVDEQRFDWSGGPGRRDEPLRVARTEHRAAVATPPGMATRQAVHARADQVALARTVITQTVPPRRDPDTLPSPKEARLLAVHDLFVRLAAAPPRSPSAARDHARLAAQLWQRAATPLGVVLLAAFGAAVVFALPARAALGLRIASALAIAIAFKYAADVAAPLVVLYGWPAPLAAVVPLAVLLLAVLVLLGWQRAVNRPAPPGSSTANRPRSRVPH